MKTPISFRLRKDVDADLIAAVAGVDSRRIAELARDGLRLMLGIRTTRYATVVEKPLEKPLEKPSEKPSSSEISVRTSTAIKTFTKPVINVGKSIQERG